MGRRWATCLWRVVQGLPTRPEGRAPVRRTRPHIHGAVAHSGSLANPDCADRAKDVLGQDKAGLIATVDHADMRGLVTDWTSLRRGAGLSLVAGIADRYARLGIAPSAPVIARTRVLHTGPILP